MSSRSRWSGRARGSSSSIREGCSARARTRCTQLVLERGRRAIGDADLLVLVVDGREGLVGGDREIAQAVREAGKPALLAINKMDDKRARSGALEMYQLGFDPVFEIAAEHGDGVGDLLDAIVAGIARRWSCRSAPAQAE